MGRIRSGGQKQLDDLQRELSSAGGRSSEFERRAAESEEQVLLLRGQVAEADTRLALLRGEQDAVCEETFHMGADEIRAKVSQKYPELDLSFLDAEPYEACTPGAEEDEFIDISDAEVVAAPGTGDLEAPEGSPKPAAGEIATFEVGEASQPPQDVPNKSVEVVPLSDP